MLAIARDVAEAVRPNARSGMHGDSIPDAHAAVDRDRRVQVCSSPDTYACADGAMRADDSGLTDLRPIAEYRIRPDRYIPTELNAAPHDSRRMHPARR